MNICLVPKLFSELPEAEVRRSSACAYYCQLKPKTKEANMACETTRSALISLPLCYVSSLTTGVVRLTA